MLCTRLKIKTPTGEVVDGLPVLDVEEVLSVDVVEDGHMFGLDGDGVLHMQGRVIVDRLTRTISVEHE